MHGAHKDTKDKVMDTGGDVAGKVGLGKVHEAHVSAAAKTDEIHDDMMKHADDTAEKIEGGDKKEGEGEEAAPAEEEKKEE